MTSASSTPSSFGVEPVEPSPAAAAFAYSAAPRAWLTVATFSVALLIISKFDPPSAVCSSASAASVSVFFSNASPSLSFSSLSLMNFCVE
ncbi:unannotated protein [freshwater metagenome]|uniref:Unannotated protein n=1 Tax=freshwater metagenome TaxID=449393 RepID=A0A6J7SSW0_9ZZZZ